MPQFRASVAPITCEVCAGLGYIQYAVLPNGDEFELPPGIADIQVYNSWPNCRIFVKDCQCEVNRRERIRREKLLMNSNIPEKFRAYSFATWDELSDDQRAEKAWSRQVLESFAWSGRGLEIDGSVYLNVILSGKKGLGKSGLAASAANQLLANGVELSWLDCATFIADVQDTYGRKDDDPRPSGNAMISATSSTPLLFIDDMGDPDSARIATDDARRILFGIINTRYSMLRPTVITTNLNFEGFTRMFGGRLADRVYELGYWIDMNGINLRYRSN